MNIVSDSNLFVLIKSQVRVYMLIYVDDILLTRPNIMYIQ